LWIDETDNVSHLATSLYFAGKRPLIITKGDSKLPGVMTSNDKPPSRKTTKDNAVTASSYMCSSQDDQKNSRRAEVSAELM
jgi:hypothetical protein